MATLTAEPGYDAPVYDLEDCPAAPLRDAPLWEKALRGVAAVLVVVCTVLAFNDRMAEPRQADRIDSLLIDVNAGRVARLDDHNRGEVLWQNHGGARYRTGLGDVDLRATLAAQPYVRQHPNAFTTGPIDAGSIRDEGIGTVFALGPFLMLSAVVQGPQPRHLTRWAWALLVLTGIGVLPYLLLSGAWGRAGPPPPRRRVNGWVALVLLMAVSGSIKQDVDTLYEDRHVVATNGAYVTPVRHS